MTVACDGVLGCYMKTGGRSAPSSAGKHAPWPQFCDSRPEQLAATSPSTYVPKLLWAAEVAGVAR
jgi:hypothetical protein